MTDTTNGGQPAQESPAQLNVLAQYVKDLSFENPNAPRSLAPNQAQPSIGIQINVGVAPLSETDYEVSLKLEGKAENTGNVLFAVDLTTAASRRSTWTPSISLRSTSSAWHRRRSRRPLRRQAERVNVNFWFSQACAHSALI
jgi:preprotein translocase subunit SecB